MTFEKQTAGSAKTKDAGFAETVKTVLYAVLIAFGVRTFAFEPFNIPSGSMIPTLLIGDYLFVSKYSYGYSKHTIAFGLPVFEGRIMAKMPERGDVIVFKLPRDNKTDYIKRIVGLPGDTIQMIGGILHINGQPVKRDRIEDFVTQDALGRTLHVAQYVETLPNGRSHRIIEETDNGPLDNTPAYKVPEGHVFMMGDNRDNSLDSRVPAQVGFVPLENLVGRAEFLFFSLDEGTRFFEVWRWPMDLRFSRLFSGVK
ncbi:signal peptidase I [Azospirillum thermophilum]|uniref:Signal peptidase I n=1 Tax=Azospirillum thermophilum TaxID=2202148 RepID=A0A2S2CX26_9PROT|nr:signal peptidase I [Azospirillum thermophilum]AWK89029.1 signal peptidase I [Azospirillum thermophilum]